VLETDVHFPTDLNLHWDAGRKCVDQSVPVADRLLGRYGPGRVFCFEFRGG